METQTLPSPIQAPRLLRRLALSLPAIAAGWLAATFVTLPFEWLELWRNAAPGALARPMLDGTLLWSAFTLAVCAALWCVVVLPMAILAPARLILRHRRLLVAGFPALAVLLIGWKLEVWRDLVWEKGVESPFVKVLLWEYWLFGVAVALSTTLVYTRLLRRSLTRG